MKTKVFAPFVVVALFALAGCGQSAKEAELGERLAQKTASLASREALDELKLARERAKLAGAKFASDGKLIRSYQCDTRLAAERLGQVSGYKRFADEMRAPFHQGCVREARIILTNLQLAAEKARRDAAKKLTLAAKKGNKK